jgi:hypothetical protein
MLMGVVESPFGLSVSSSFRLGVPTCGLEVFSGRLPSSSLLERDGKGLLGDRWGGIKKKVRGKGRRARAWRFDRGSQQKEERSRRRWLSAGLVVKGCSK